MGMFDDAIAFLAEHEDESESERNERTTLTQSEIDEIRKQHPGIPSDYLAYLKEIGWGSFRECQYVIYSGLTDPEDIFGEETAARFGDKRVLLFGDRDACCRWSQHQHNLWVTNATSFCKQNVGLSQNGEAFDIPWSGC